VLETVLARLLGDTAVGSFKSVRRRFARRPSPAATDEGAAERRAITNDFGTGLGQATMAVRDAVEAFERLGVLVDPDEGTLYEGLGDPLGEAHRVVDEVEARLPRVQMAFGPKSAVGSAAAEGVAELREALNQLHDYYAQSDEGEWSDTARDAARGALERARGHQEEFLDLAAQAR
jgi:hypothetical protein